MKSWQAELYLFLVTFIWGGTFVFTKIGLGFCPPSLYIIIRFTTALLLSLIFFGKHLRKLDKTTALHGIVLGLLFGGGFLLQTYGLKMTTVSKSAFITGITVVLTPFVYWLVERKPISLFNKIGVAIVAVGLWLFTNPDFDNINYGDVLTLFSTLFWAFYITYMDVFTRGRQDRGETSLLVMMQFVAAFPPAALAYFAFEGGGPGLILSRELLMSLLYNAVLASFVVTFIHTSIQRYTTPVKASLIFTLEPVVASIVAFAWLGEKLGEREIAGAAIIFSGVLFSEVLGLSKKMRPREI